MKRLSHLTLLVSVLFVAHDTGLAQPVAVSFDTDTFKPLFDFQNRQSDKELFLLQQDKYRAPFAEKNGQYNSSGTDNGAGFGIGNI